MLVDPFEQSQHMLLAVEIDKSGDGRGHGHDNSGDYRDDPDRLHA